MSNILKIDKLTIQDHCFLTYGEDECWYFFNYTANEGFAYSETNSLILNLKKSVDQKGKPHYIHKARAINKIASYLSKIKFTSNVILVPVPPSKSKSDPLYDDRMLQILTEAFKHDQTVEIRELVIQVNSTEASHLQQNRPSINQLQDNYELDPIASVNLNGTVFLVDDVLTTGAHFKAIKNLISATYPNVVVKGLFNCRREL